MLFIFSTPELIRHLWQLQTVVFLHWCLMYALPFASYSRLITSVVMFEKDKINPIEMGLHSSLDICKHPQICKKSRLLKVYLSLQLDYRVFVVEQTNFERFNRGILVMILYIKTFTPSLRMLRANKLARIFPVKMKEKSFYDRQSML